ncbi:hypothetical protein BJ165DRAFT_1337758 [Panaeolus papilionaceus]|nr:hypothetical protein BJ165DRAFT_1337758 [Panaeolus papilionaceus]
MPFFAMRQSANIPPIFQLPDEIIEEIVAELHLHRDLIAFALTSKISASLVIPHHTQYRILRVRHSLPEMWAHLARRSDLTRNIREVHISSPSQNTVPDRYPTALIDKKLDGNMKNSDEATRIRNMCQALRHMCHLRVFNWSWEDGSSLQRPTSHPAYENAIIKTLHDLTELETVRLDGSFAFHALSSAQDSESQTYPGWRLSNLTSLSLTGKAFAKTSNSKHISRLLSQSPNLESLEAPVEFQHLVDCKLPKLKRLKLSMVSGLLSGMDTSRAIFLQAHPSIEELHWLPTGQVILAPGSLPNLRIVKSNRQLMEALEATEVMTPCPLTPPSTPVASSAPSLEDQPTLVEKPLPVLRQIECMDITNMTAQSLLDAKCLDRAALRRLTIGSFDDISTLHEVAEAFPNIEWISLPPVHLPSDSTHPEVVKRDGWVEIFSKFPKLKIIRGAGIWACVGYDKQAMHEMIGDLIQVCPNLSELDHSHYSTRAQATRRIVIKRSGEHGEMVTYGVHAPHIR